MTIAVKLLHNSYEPYFMSKNFSLLKYETRSIEHKNFTEHHLIVKNITSDDMGIYVAKSKSISLSAQLSIVDDDKAKGVNYLFTV